LGALTGSLVWQGKKKKVLQEVFLMTAGVMNVCFYFSVTGGWSLLGQVRDYVLTAPMLMQLAMAGLSVAGYVGYLLLHHPNKRGHLSIGLAALGWWWMLAGHLGLESRQWYWQPLVWYLIGWAEYHYLRDDMKDNDVVLASLSFGGSAWLWYIEALGGTYLEIYGDLLALLTGLVCLFAGYWWQKKAVKIMAAVIITIAVFLQTVEYLLQVPWWVWLALGGAIILAWATKQLQKKS
jgi:hypothetical protein